MGAALLIVPGAGETVSRRERSIAYHCGDSAMSIGFVPWDIGLEPMSVYLGRLLARILRLETREKPAGLFLVGTSTAAVERP